MPESVTATSERKTVECVCTNTRHGHGNPCGKPNARVDDHLCSRCYDTAADEWAKAQSLTSLSEVMSATTSSEWTRILREYLASAIDGQDPTHRVSLLKSATKKPRDVPPSTSIRQAITLMMQNDYSQLPVLEARKSVRGMFSWRSYGKRLALSREPQTVGEALEPAQILDLDAWIFEAFAAVSRDDSVLIRDVHQEICGIVTAYDVSETFGTLAEPFLLIEEIEKHVRALLKGRVSPEEIEKASIIKMDGEAEPQVSDLTFGGYVRLLNNEEVWARLSLNLDKEVFVQSLRDVNGIRNDVMHFRAIGIGSEKLSTLRNFAKFLREVRAFQRSLPQKHVES